MNQVDLDGKVSAIYADGAPISFKQTPSGVSFETIILKKELIFNARNDKK